MLLYGLRDRTELLGSPRKSLCQEVSEQGHGHHPGSTKALLMQVLLNSSLGFCNHSLKGLHSFLF